MAIIMSDIHFPSIYFMNYVCSNTNLKTNKHVAKA